MRNSMIYSANDTGVREGKAEGNSGSELEDSHGKQWSVS